MFCPPLAAAPVDREKSSSAHEPSSNPASALELSRRDVVLPAPGSLHLRLPRSKTGSVPTAWAIRVPRLRSHSQWPLVARRFGVDYEQSNWAALLPRVIFSINNSTSSATGFSPFFVERGRDPLIPLDRDAAIMSRTPIREDTK